MKKSYKPKYVFRILIALVTLLVLTMLLPDFSEAGRIRSSKARRDFQKTQPCPSTGNTTGSCPGYIIDHVIPLKGGGADHPDNMQWQTIKEAKEKDKWE